MLMTKRVDFSLVSVDTSVPFDPTGRYSFSLLDTTTGNVTFECMDCQFAPEGTQDMWEDSYASYGKQVCLPKDHCHRFLIGINHERSWHSRPITEDFESFTLNWDGESVLDGFNAFTFGRIDFGQCESKCSSDQAEFEFYMTRNQTEYGSHLAWKSTGGDGSVLYADSAPVGASLLHNGGMVDL